MGVAEKWGARLTNDRQTPPAPKAHPYCSPRLLNIKKGSPEDAVLNVSRC